MPRTSSKAVTGKAPAKKSTPAAAKKAAPAKKATQSRAARNAEKAAAPSTPPAAVETVEVPPAQVDPLLAELAKKAAPLREKGLTLAEIATELGVSAAVAREVVEGTPTARPRKTGRASSSERVSNGSVKVETTDEVIKCRRCEQDKPARQFPTITGPLHRATECRACRDARREAAATV